MIDAATTQCTFCPSIHSSKCFEIHSTTTIPPIQFKVHKGILSVYVYRQANFDHLGDLVGRVATIRSIRILSEKAS